MNDIKLPIRRARGHQSPKAIELYDDSLRSFAEDLKTLQGTLDFHMGSRDWCYYLESMGLNKGDFDWGEQQIREARLRGFLRPGFLLEEDGHRVVEQNERPSTPEEYSTRQYDSWKEAEAYFVDSSRFYDEDEVSFWHGRACYLQVLVEKAALRSLFQPLCDQYKIPIANMRGWGSLEQKAVMAAKFREMEAEGMRPVLLACGDFDPPGLAISGVLHKQFEEYRLFTGWDPEGLEVDRIGLNLDFIEENGLTWVDGLETGSGKNLADPRHAMHKANTYGIREYIAKHGARKVEANAVLKVPELGRTMLQNAIDKHLGPDAYAGYASRIAAGREEVQRLITERMESESGEAT